MTIIYIWIAICVGFVLGAAWTASKQKKVVSDRLFCMPDTGPANGTDHRFISEGH